MKENVFSQLYTCNMDLYFRIRCAQSLLRETEYSAEEVAKRSGFRDRLYFSRFFHKKFGSTPTEYRRASRVGDDRRQFDVL